MKNEFARIWVLTLLVKIFFGGMLPLSSDESYYWVWSRHLQLSYYDHPPFVAWLFLLGSPLENFGSLVRLPGILMGHFTFFIWHEILSPYFLNLEKKETYYWWLLILLTNPLVGWGSIIITPDLPLIFFWSLSILGMLRWREPRWQVITGISLGLGICSKYTIVLLPMIAILWAIGTRQTEKFKLKELFICGFVAIIFSSPVILWNWHNDFVSFKYQLNHGLGSPSYNWRWTSEYIGGQLLLVFPTLFFLALHRLKRGTELSWLPYFGWGPLIFFGLSSFKGRSEANWPVVGYPALYTLAIINARSLLPIKVAFLFWVVAFGIILSEVIHPWLPFESGRIKTTEFYEYDELIPVVQSHQPVYASSLQMASSLSFLIKKPIYKLRGIGRRDVYDFLPQSSPKEDHFFVILRRWDNLPAWTNIFHVIETPLPQSDPNKFRLLELKLK